MTRIEIEYILNSSPRILFDRLSTETGLSEWFADEVFINDNIYTFVWEGVEETAELLGIKDLDYIRFRWTDCENEEVYFEFKIQNHELTNEVSLIVTDFAINDEREEVIELWETQINNLKYLIGA
ncbi:MAG: START-like domain-containing protein [Bacteroidota bacterium]|jgi:uncharacterized protein YndB with AHSA1/START domain|nr:SRPBCC domain-containing protein [Bacteroidales bacterium]MDI9535660.1 START-like domain-containing protein [Bacteroidota bacterium]OQC46518.1 MAG: hypothetical protein BWX59_00382 [Bacteroidetes bacterium ADurb.Bin028]NLP21013.1 SRPBCC domain-containing protein [Bacteroidales bacterium]HNY43794.1 START-like domain-containing protein [Bacteroidales bacterium]